MTYTSKAEITINAPAAKVWQALTEPAMVKQWLFGTEMSVTDWKVGGQIRYRGVWEGKAYEDKGEILEIAPEKLLKSTYWSAGSGLPDAPENYQVVSYELFPQDAGTKVVITQENVISQDSADHSASNWQMVLTKMKEILEK